MLQNSKDEALNNAFKVDPGGCVSSAGGGMAECGLQELTKHVISEVKNMPGNRHCCDCGAPGRLDATQTLWTIRQNCRRRSPSMNDASLQRAREAAHGFTLFRCDRSCAVHSEGTG